MRSHNHLGPQFSASARWNFAHGTRGEVTNVVRNPVGSEATWSAFSHSGNESNRTFINAGSGGFVDGSALSGSDSRADGRSFVYWDFNRDGRLDIAVVNANRPLLQVFANRTGDNPRSRGNRFIAFDLTGGQRTSSPLADLSNRDAIGASIEIEAGGRKLLRALSAGEGFASQNSKIVVVGIGQSIAAESIRILFPSGRSQSVGPVPAGTLIEIDEIRGETGRSAYADRR